MKLLTFLSIKNLVLLSIILFPFDQLFSSAFPNFPVSPFRILTVVLSLFFFRYNIGKLRPFKVIIVLFYVYCGWSFLSIFWSNDLNRSLAYSFQILLMIWFAIVAISELIKDENAYKKVAFYGPIVGGIVAQLSLLGIFSDRELSLDRRLSFAGIGVNAIAISIGYMFILGVSFLMIKGPRFLNKMVVISCCIIMFYFIIRTGTRSGVFGVLIALGMAYIFSYKVNFVNLIRFFVSAGLLYFTFNFILDNYLGDRLAERIFKVGAEDIEDNPRSQLWGVAFDYFSHNIFGTGAGNESVAYIEFGLGPREAHNVFVSGLLQLGIIGFLLIICTQIIVFFKLNEIRRPIFKYSALSLYFFLLMQMMKGSFLQTRLFWVPIILIISIGLLDSKHRSSSDTSF